MTNKQKRMLEPTLNRDLYRNIERSTEIESFALSLFQEFQPVDYMRADFRVPLEPRLPPRLLEVNICCNLGSHSSMSFAAETIGITQAQMVARILDHSFRRQNMGR